MKKFLITFLLSISFYSNAFAQSTTVINNLNGLGMSSELSNYVASITVGSAIVVDNNTYIKVRNAANSGNLSILKADATDDTVLNADTGDVIKLSVAGTTEATLDNDSLTFSGASFSFIPGATSLLFRNTANNATNLSITDAGVVALRSTLSSTATSDIGWALVSGANTACNTTCTNACVVGQNTANFALVSCTDATADVCLCAGAS